MVFDPHRSLTETLAQGEIRTGDVLSSLANLLASLVTLAATTLFKLAVVMSAKAVFLWGLKKATLHNSAVIHVKVGWEQVAHLYDYIVGELTKEQDQRMNVAPDETIILQGVFLTVPSHFQYQNEKNLFSQRLAFLN